MKFNFLKNGYSSLMDSNAFNTFGLFKKSFFVSCDSDLILIFKNELKEESENYVQSEYNRYAFKKAYELEIDSPLADSDIETDIIKKSIIEAPQTIFEIDGKLLPNPDYSIGNGNCAYSFVLYDGKVYISVPNYFITMVRELATSETSSYENYCVDLKSARLIKKVFGEDKFSFSTYGNNKYFVFENENYRVVVKNKQQFSGSFNKHIQAIKIASRLEMRTLDLDKLNNLLKDYKDDDYLNKTSSGVKYIANPNYIFNIENDDYYVTSDVNSDVDCYENIGKTRLADTNFTTSFEILKTIVKEIPENLRYIKFSKDMSAEGVDKDWFDETNIFASADSKTAIYFN